jgi:Activator of Hsp90 ATPase homolog 1-like protein
MIGEFVEVDPPRRIAFTWGWEAETLVVPPQSTAVEVSFTPEGDETVVRVVHRRLPPPAVDFHRAGWDHYLGRLSIAAGGGDPGPDPWQGGGGLRGAGRGQSSPSCESCEGTDLSGSFFGRAAAVASLTRLSRNRSSSSGTAPKSTL